MQPDGNAVRLPRGFASGETPLQAAAGSPDVTLSCLFFFCLTGTGEEGAG